MGSQAPSFHQCDYLSLPCDISEIVRINEKINLLDAHIQQLTELRHTLHRHSLQLQNLHSPIHTLPTEVLSHIFFQLAGSEGDLVYAQDHLNHLRQSLALSSVTTHFRQIALDTAGLWRRVPLVITGRFIGKVVALLRHCVSHAPHVNVLIWDYLRGNNVSSTIDFLFAPDITPKINTFELKYSSSSGLWLERLRLASFINLRTVGIGYECNRLNSVGVQNEVGLRVNLGTVISMTWLCIYSPCLTLPIVIPPSILILHLVNVPDNIQISILYQCPNLTEFFSIPKSNYISGAQFETPFTLTHLKKLTYSLRAGLNTLSSVQNLDLPSLEYLMLDLVRAKFDPAHWFCCKVSSTLTTLILLCFPDTFDLDKLRLLFRIPFPKLQTLEIHHYDERWPMADILLALAPKDDSEAVKYLYNLQILILFCKHKQNLLPRYILDLLDKWNRVGELSWFRVEVTSGSSSGSEGGHGVFEDKDWSDDLREELKSIVGEREIEVVWGNCKLL